MVIKSKKKKENEVRKVEQKGNGKEKNIMKALFDRIC